MKLLTNIYACNMFGFSEGTEIKLNKPNKGNLKVFSEAKVEEKKTNYFKYLTQVLVIS